MWPGSLSSQAKACCYTPALRSPLSSPDAEGASEGEQVNAMQPIGSKPVPAASHSVPAGARLLDSRVYTAGEMKVDSKPLRPGPPTLSFCQSVERLTARDTASAQLGTRWCGHSRGPMAFCDLFEPVLHGLGPPAHRGTWWRPRRGR